MKNLFLITAATAVLWNAVGAAAGERPTFELRGFPITPHQVAVLGSPHVLERAPTPTLMLGGMPASPHQMCALRPRPGATGPVAATLTKTVSSRKEAN